MPPHWQNKIIKLYDKQMTTRFFYNKRPKTAIIACIRKIIVTLNSRVQDNTSGKEEAD